MENPVFGEQIGPRLRISGIYRKARTREERTDIFKSGELGDQNYILASERVTL